MRSILPAAVVGMAVGCAHRPAVPVSAWGDPALTWQPCPDDLGGPAVACSLVEVPLDWLDAASDRSAVLVRRLGSGSTRQLWALDGGPGFAGDAFFDPAFASRVTDAGLDLYVVSHRGTIGPTALRCPAQHLPESDGGGMVTTAEWPACLATLQAQWGDGLTPFSSRFAAKDVAHAMARAGNPEQVLVFGGSYGTLWAHRLLLDTEARIDGVLLDSIVPIGASLERVDAQADRAAEGLLSGCAEQPACAAMFDGDPVAAARTVIAAFDRGEGCGQADGELDRARVQRFMRSRLDGSPDHWRALVAGFARLARCGPGDVAAVTALLAAPAPRPTGSSPAAIRYNLLLNRHLLYRELYRFEVTDEERAAWVSGALAASSESEAVARESGAFGATYRRVEKPARASSAVPTTLLSGRFDPLDDPGWAKTFAGTLSEVHRVEIPWAGHSTLRYLGLGPDGCGTQVLESFLATGQAETGCIAAMEPPALDSRLDD